MLVGDWGKSEMSGAKVQSWRMGSFLLRDVRTSGAGLEEGGITEQEQTVEERRALEACGG